MMSSTGPSTSPVGRSTSSSTGATKADRLERAPLARSQRRTPGGAAPVLAAARAAQRTAPAELPSRALLRHATRRPAAARGALLQDRKSTRLNSSHGYISYA